MSMCTDKIIVDVLTHACHEVQLPRHPSLVFSLVVLPDSEMQTFNLRFRRYDKPTNVLSFPNQDITALWSAPVCHTHSPMDLGDILLGMNVMVAEAQAQNKTLFHHTMHLIVHGFLHLLHFDHQTDEDAAIMEGIETAIFRHHQWPNPYDDGLSGVTCVD